MKNFFSSMRMLLMPVAGLLTVAILLSACTKFDNDDNSNNTPVAGLLSFNLAPDQPAVGIAIGSNALTNSPLAFTNYSGTYQRIFPGTRTIESYDFRRDSTISKVDFSFNPDKYYSLFVVGGNGNYRNVITQDNFDSLSATAGKAYIRYVNAIPDSTQPLVTFAAGGTSVISDNAPFTAVSDFREISSGDVAVSVNNNTTINSSRTISLEQGKVYTVLLVGRPGETDSTRSVQIKFITNGSLDSNQ